MSFFQISSVTFPLLATQYPLAQTGESLIFAKDFFGHPARKNRQKLNATVYFAAQAPIRPRPLAPTQPGVRALLPHDLTALRDASVFRLR